MQRGGYMLRRRRNTNEEEAEEVVVVEEEEGEVVTVVDESDDETSSEDDSNQVNAQDVDMGVDMQNVGLCLAGILLFKNAKILSRSRSFHYTTGASAGVLLSWCVVLVLLYKFMPLKRYVIGLMVAIGGAGMFCTRKLFENAVYLVIEYPKYVISLSAISALLSLALLSLSTLYYYGTPSSEDTRFNLVQWFLQLSAILVVYQSSYSKQVSITMVTMLVLSEFCSMTNFLAKLMTMIIPHNYMYMLHAPPKRRYLTQEEYEHQGVVETEQALRELREFCNSPKFNSSDVASRIKQPKRFADFLHTSRHVPDDEIHMHEETDDFYQVHEDHNKICTRSISYSFQG